MSGLKTLHLGCVHSSDDTRIRKKECATLSQAGYEVVYLTASQSMKESANSDRHHDGVVVKGGEYDTRGVLITKDALSFIKYRITNKQKIINLIIEENPDILHIHELELMYVLKAVRKKIPNIKVVFDVHENYPGTYYDLFFENTNKLIAILVKSFVSRRLKKYLKLSDAIITVTPTIARYLNRYGCDVTMVCNFPIIGETGYVKEPDTKSDAKVCYCGLMNERRGTNILLEHINEINATILLAGPCSETYIDYLSGVINRNPEKIKYYGTLPQNKIFEIYKQSMVGICCYKKSQNNYNAYPTKIFEYMMAGLPVVCSNFPAWRDIVEESQCGILVDPEKGEEIAGAINNLIANSDVAKKMGENGLEAVKKTYNWNNEAQKLIELYRKLEQSY